jgi:hypothetical protein
MKEVGKSLKDLKHVLTHFELWVWGCHHVTNDGLHHVLDGLHHVEHLKGVKLYLCKFFLFFGIYSLKIILELAMGMRLKNSYMIRGI